MPRETQKCNADLKKNKDMKYKKCGIITKDVTYVNKNMRRRRTERNRRDI